MPKKRVLIIDDEKNMRHMLETMLGKQGYDVASAANGMEALEKMARGDFDFILCDIRMPEMDGMAFLEKSIASFPEKTYIMMSAYGTVETALDAIKKGAYDYISKPFKADEVLLTLRKAEERERLKAENTQLKNQIRKIEQKYSFGNIIARSESMARVFDLVKTVADHKTTILITGESGTGKELIAKAIHMSSIRASAPLVSINCGGIPQNLLESELFGYRKGAFTDAMKDKPGRFEEAHTGTLFLDEIGELPLPLQVKLLRVLQEEEITPLGDVGSKKIDVRIITATARNLIEEVEAGRFREDLFYRINVMAIHLPPLRERRGDIPLLVGYFIGLFNKKLNKGIEGLSSEAMPILMEHPWPGNVRELENVMERAVLLAKGSWITPRELPATLTTPARASRGQAPGDTLSIKKASKQLERELIEKALKLTGGNRTRASKILEISRPILIAKIKEYGLG
jgi:two-component system, NtrC family, response regulator AtoC